eukprot:UC1_evm1s1143
MGDSGATSAAAELANAVSLLALSPTGSETAGSSNLTSSSDKGVVGAGISVATHLEKRRIAVVLDLHYLQVAALQHSLKTTWDPAEFESFLSAKLDGQIVSRYAADSETSSGPGSHAGNVSKGKLHERLKQAGYTLVLSPNKRVTAGGGGGGSSYNRHHQQHQQGGTDVAVASLLYRAAGAFAPAPEADEVALVAGDSDFQYALEHIAAASSAAWPLRLTVVATANTLRSEYRTYLQESATTRWVDLVTILQAMAPHVLDLRPNIAGALPLASDIVTAAVYRLSGLAASSGKRGRIGGAGGDSGAPTVMNEQNVGGGGGRETSPPPSDSGGDGGSDFMAAAAVSTDAHAKSKAVATATVDSSSISGGGGGGGGGGDRVDARRIGRRGDRRGGGYGNTEASIASSASGLVLFLQRHGKGLDDSTMIAVAEGLRAELEQRDRMSAVETTDAEAAEIPAPTSGGITSTAAAAAAAAAAVATTDANGVVASQETTPRNIVGDLGRHFEAIWVHHTAITDASVNALGNLLAVLHLRELHISDTRISVQGLTRLAVAAAAAGYGSAAGPPPLYINAAHLRGPIHMPPTAHAAVMLKLERTP